MALNIFVLSELPSVSCNGPHSSDRQAFTEWMNNQVSKLQRSNALKSVTLLPFQKHNPLARPCFKPWTYPN